MNQASPLPDLQLETPRLLLRPTRLEDFEPWAAMMAEPETMRFLGGVQPRAVAWRGFMSMAGAWSLTGVAMFSVIEKASGRWIGRLGPWCPEGWPGTEVGWGLIQAACGQGYAAEGSAAAMDYAFDRLGWDRVIHTIAPDNHASQRLAARLGSVNEGRCLLPAPYSDTVVDAWAQTRTQWRAHRQQQLSP